MKSEDEIRSEMRLWALELLTTNVFVMLCAIDPNPKGLLDMISAQIKRGAAMQTFPNSDPATSDLYASELEDALTRLMGMAYEQMRRSQ